VPLVSHEIGQYQIYPDYREIEKYTGVVRAWNLEIFRDRLKKSGMLDQHIDFQKASGAWSALCYKAEMEAALRSAGMAGFQLLDLQDFPGQGTALVGILDAFMDSKNVILQAEWLQSCHDVVLLLQFTKFCWQTNDNFQLQQGEKVLLFPAVESIKDKSVAGLFPPDFWYYGMFKGISERVKKPVSPGTLGILTDPGHPLFNSFPTDFHTNWQWWSIINASRPLILDKTAHQYRPIVQIIDNLERNYKLGLVFEFALGKGKLLVCMARLNDILEKPEAYHLHKSIINYMKTDEFSPEYSVDSRLLHDLL